MATPYPVPASGTVPWVTVPSNDYVFKEDVWVQAIEVRPGNRAVVHHAVAGAVRGPAEAGDLEAVERNVGIIGEAMNRILQADTPDSTFKFT